VPVAPYGHSHRYAPPPCPSTAACGNRHRPHPACAPGSPAGAETGSKPGLGEQGLLVLAAKLSHAVLLGTGANQTAHGPGTELLYLYLTLRVLTHLSPGPQGPGEPLQAPGIRFQRLLPFPQDPSVAPAVQANCTLNPRTGHPTGGLAFPPHPEVLLQEGRGLRRTDKNEEHGVRIRGCYLHIKQGSPPGLLTFAPEPRSVPAGGRGSQQQGPRAQGEVHALP